MSLDFTRRLRGLQEKMVEVGFDLVVFGSCQNFQYLTGLLMDWRRGVDLAKGANCVLVPKEGEAILTLAEESSEFASQTWIRDVRISKKGEEYGALVKKAVSDLALKGGKIGIGDHVFGSTLVELERSIEGASFHSAEALMDDLRMIKDAGEIEFVRKVAALTDRVMESLIPKIKAGVTQRELQLEVEFCGRLQGASDVSFPPTAGFVKSGSEISPDAFTYPKEKGLAAGTSVAFDMGFVMDGYCSDFGRSFYFGSAGREVKEGYDALHGGVLDTVDKMFDGSMRVCDVFPVLEKILDKLGYGQYLRARLKTRTLGHNIGVEVHEPPWLSPAYDQMLCTNMVMALEPKVWHAGEYYLRVEDVVLIGHKKSEILTNFDRELFEL